MEAKEYLSEKLAKEDNYNALDKGLLVEAEKFAETVEKEFQNILSGARNNLLTSMLMAAAKKKGIKIHHTAARSIAMETKKGLF